MGHGPRYACIEVDCSLVGKDKIAKRLDEWGGKYAFLTLDIAGTGGNTSAESQPAMGIPGEALAFSLPAGGCLGRADKVRAYYPHLAALLLSRLHRFRLLQSEAWKGREMKEDLRSKSQQYFAIR